MKTILNITGKQLSWVLLVAGLTWALALRAQEGDVVARDAWVRIPAPSKTETALYVLIENHSAQKRKIVSAASDAAAKVEFHKMTMENKVMSMKPVDQVDIPAHGKTSFDPNGLHIMLFGLKTRPEVGDKVAITLTLDNGAKVVITATARKG
jgi:copper(I)-binding protein